MSLDYTELKPGTIIVYESQPWTILEYNFARSQMRKPVVQVKMKNIISGKVVEKGFQAADAIEEADIEKKPAKFLYRRAGRKPSDPSEIWFCEEKDPSKRFQLSEDIVGDCVDLIKPNSLVETMVFDEKIIGINPPIKVELKVVEAPPAIKGNTAQGGSKQVTLETGAVINVPLFINEGDIIKINTKTREYTERVQK